MKKACRTALENSRKILLPVASEYWLTITYRYYAYKVVESQIGNSIKSPKTREQVIEDFFATELKSAFEEISFWTKMLGIFLMFMIGSTMYVAWQIRAEQATLAERKRR